MSPTSASGTSHSSRNRRSDGSDGDGLKMPEIDITNEEFKRIKEALNNQEFRKMFLDYIDEIQDPENRKIYECEIKQLEAERGVDVTFVNPEPGFVINTSINGVIQGFINVAKSDAVARPSSEMAVDDKNGSQGLNWSLPMAQSPPHDDLDEQGKRCRIYDVVFHPDALHMAERSSEFRKCLIDTSLDAVEREFAITLDRTNIKFPDIKYKGYCHPTVIRKLVKHDTSAGEPAEPHPFEHVFPRKPTEEETRPKLMPPPKKPTQQPQFTTPLYVIKHRRGIDLAECTNELDAKLNVTLPRELVVEIELPLLNSSAECQLDVTVKSVYMRSERPGAKYCLTVKLPYAVDDKKGTARFNTDKRQLVITLPVLQKSASDQRHMHDMLLRLNREDSGIDCDMREEVSTSAIATEPLLMNELINELEDATVESPAEKTVFKEVEMAVNYSKFLKNNIAYKIPSKFDCHVLDNVVSIILHVCNVQSESIVLQKQHRNVHLQFTTTGSGFYPTYYAFFAQLPAATCSSIERVETEACDNTVEVNLHLSAYTEKIESIWAGLHGNELSEYLLPGKFENVNKAIATKITAPVEEHKENVVVDEIRVCKEENSLGDDDEDDAFSCSSQQGVKKGSKKYSKKKDKKRRSFSESACDDIKAYQQHQHQHHHQHQHQQVHEVIQEVIQPLSKHDETITDQCQQQPIPSASVAVPNACSGQQRKQRSLSECRAGATACKGILKHNSRYDHPFSLNNYSSSMDDYSSYSCSAEGSVGSALHSFCDIPEEKAVESLSESCKKTVRFNEIITKQIFKLDSSILGQRKKNQKRRERKQRALQRRLSEGDSADYEDHKNDMLLPYNAHKIRSNYLSSNNCNHSDGDSNKLINNTDSMVNGNNISLSKNTAAQKQHHKHWESEESSSDADANKNSMMFQMDM